MNYGANSTSVTSDSHFFKSKLFKSKIIDRVTFDPNNSDHRIAYATFVNQGKWIMNFFVEHPYLSVPHTIQAKLAEYASQR